MSSAIADLNQKLSNALARNGHDFSHIPVAAGRLLSDILIEEQEMDPVQVNDLLEQATGIPALDPSMVAFEPAFIEHVRGLIPAAVAYRECVFPVRHEDNFVHLVMALPEDTDAVRRIEALTGSRIRPYCCYGAGILEALQTHYGEPEPQIETDGKDIEPLIEQAVAALNRLRLADASQKEIINDVALIRLLQSILAHLVETGSSDLHFEPQQDRFKIRYRKDGVLHTAWSLPKTIQAGLLPRLKLISGLNLDDSRLPQDGSIAYDLIEGRDIDIRVSTLPSLYGEKIVLRILEKDRRQFSLQDLGMADAEATRLNQVIQRPTGLILVTGPTGSGKTTTLYAILSALNTDQVNIVAAEDPVEYKLAGITQVTCSQESGLDFNTALKSFLRQDPDIIMVGEMRDLETADIGLKSAMTGHLVLSTLHTNDAPSAINRLINMGVPPYLVASAQVTVLAQRLMRKICPQCKTLFEPEPETLTLLGLNSHTSYYRGTGCEACAGTGYHGRIGIYELFLVNDEIIDLILEKKPSAQLKAVAKRSGMTTLRQAAIAKLNDGLSTVEEVLRVTMDT